MNSGFKSKTTQSKTIREYCLRNSNGMDVILLNYGTRIHSIRLPTRQGLKQIVLNYPKLTDYLTDKQYIGGTIGRFSNRIKKGRFVLNGTTIQLTQNESEHHLHGGYRGFHHQFWAVDSFDHQQIQFSYSSMDSEEGYPGNLSVTMKVTLNDSNQLTIEWQAYTNKKTIINLTNHSYFNLDGIDSLGTINGHQLKLYSDYYLSKDKLSLPTFDKNPLSQSIYDFNDLRPITSTIIDHSFQSRQQQVAQLYSQQSGISMIVASDYPSFQVYTGDYLHNPFQPRQGCCIEPQFYPDDPNISPQPASILEPDSVFKK